LRVRRAGGADWAQELRQLLDDLLAVPPDPPRDQGVRESLFGSLDSLARLDDLMQPGHGIPLALVRAYVAEQLEAIPTNAGELLTGGVTIAGPSVLLPIPFRVVYVVGLGESQFPGSDVRSSLDLRARNRLPGDVEPSEANRFLFLQALLAGREKVYLSYNCRDLQRDQDLFACGPINQLRRYLEEHLVEGKKFEFARVPLSPADSQYLAGAPAGQREERQPFCDVFVNYSEPQRVLALESARRNGRIELDKKAAKQLDMKLKGLQTSFNPPAQSVLDSARPQTVTVAELCRFLRCPVEAALKRHLGLADEEDDEPLDDEPFSTRFPQDYQLVSEALRRFVARSVERSPATALESWSRDLDVLHEEWRLRGRVPEGGFGKVDLARFQERLKERIQGPGGLAEQLEALGSAAFEGPVLLGESIMPVGARQHFPALRLSLKDVGLSDARLVGQAAWVWRSDEALEILVLTNKSKARVPANDLSVPLLDPLLFSLALKAGEERQKGGQTSLEWLGNRTLRIHAAHEEGIHSFQFHLESVRPDQAREYLTMLAREFLDITSFDLLPLEIIAGDKELKEAYQAEEGAEAVGSDYCDLLQEKCEEDAENLHPKYRALKLLEIFDAKVPADAFEKVHRRLHFLFKGLEQAVEGAKTSGRARRK